MGCLRIGVFLVTKCVVRMHARHRETGEVVPLEFSLEFVGQSNGGCSVAVEGISPAQKLCVERVCFDAPNDFGNLDMALSWIVFEMARFRDEWDVAAAGKFVADAAQGEPTASATPTLGGSVVLGCLTEVLLANGAG